VEVAFGVGDGQVTGVVVVGTGFRSFGPTWPMTGMCWPMLRMNGTDLEPWS
jgi:hypothetical protein